MIKIVYTPQKNCLSIDEKEKEKEKVLAHMAVKIYSYNYKFSDRFSA